MLRPVVTTLRISTCLLWIYHIQSFQTSLPEISRLKTHTSTTATRRVTSSTRSSRDLSEWESAYETCKNDITKTCKVKVASVEHGMGLVATTSIKKGDVALAIPFDDNYSLTPELARNTVFQDVLPDNFESWTGDAGYMALLLLNELAKSTTVGAGINLPKRTDELSNFMKAWIHILPSPRDISHPLLWSEEDQEVLQSSSTNKVYRLLDDIEEDAQWLVENVFDKDRSKFPEQVMRTGETLPCFSVEGFKWAMALVQSRSFFLNKSLRLIPFLDMCNHDDVAQEIRDGTMGTFGTLKGAQLVASQNYEAGDQVHCSYGPKSAADYLLEHGFVPEQCWKTAVSELTFEVDPKDRFYDDKLDILEFETYDQAPMDPTQSFDVISAAGRDGEPDPAMVQFVRLSKLGGQDAFLLESIFRRDVWGFMELPVSEKNELEVFETISDACRRALDDFAACPEGGPEICSKLRESESRALTRTLEYLQRGKEALDLKEYYQERRLKDLGLDSDWSPEDGGDLDDLGFGQTRVPGAADYDW